MTYESVKSKYLKIAAKYSVAKSVKKNSGIASSIQTDTLPNTKITFQILIKVIQLGNLFYASDFHTFT